MSTATDRSGEHACVPCLWSIDSEAALDDCTSWYEKQLKMSKNTAQTIQHMSNLNTKAAQEPSLLCDSSNIQQRIIAVTDKKHVTT